MARISAADPEPLPAGVTAVFREQEQRWGKTLEPFHLYARRPEIFLAVRGMWKALTHGGVLPIALKALVFRRVASLNGCPF